MEQKTTSLFYPRIHDNLVDEVILYGQSYGRLRPKGRKKLK